MNYRRKLLLRCLMAGFLIGIIFTSSHAQTLKKVRMGSSSTNVSFLAIYAALHRGFYKDEGIDLEIIQ
ncbi:MAG: ABC transporter substrate-binding protein, partial [Candidatus Binatia bacterium]